MSTLLSDAAESPSALLAQPLLQTRPWLRTFAVVACLVVLANLALGAFLLVTTPDLAPDTSWSPALRHEVARRAGMIWCGLSLFFLWPTWGLQRYASLITRLDKSRDERDLLRALEAQHALWVSIVVCLLAPPLLWLAVFAGKAAYRALAS